MEDLSRFTLDNTKIDRLLREQVECSFAWIGNKNIYSCIMNYIVIDRDIFLTTTKNRAKYKHLQENPNCSITISSLGTSIIGDACINMSGKIVFVEQDKNMMLHESLSKRLTNSTILVSKLDTPNRIWMKFVSEHIKTYDGIKMARENYNEIVSTN